MPKEIKDVRVFIAIARKKDASLIIIKKSETQTKIKIRCKKYLYTHVVKDNNRAEKLIKTLPPSLKQISI